MSCVDSLVRNVLGRGWYQVVVYDSGWIYLCRSVIPILTYYQYSEYMDEYTIYAYTYTFHDSPSPMKKYVIGDDVDQGISAMRHNA